VSSYEAHQSQENTDLSFLLQPSSQLPLLSVSGSESVSSQSQETQVEQNADQVSIAPGSVIPIDNLLLQPLHLPDSHLQSDESKSTSESQTLSE